MAGRNRKPDHPPITTTHLKKLVQNEIKRFLAEGNQSWDLYLKWQEIKRWLPTQSQKNIQWVKRLIWTPKGISDYRRIEPELIFVKGEAEYEKIDIWGYARTTTLKSNDPIAEHWAILRKLISTARDTGGGGMRMLKFLVRDKVSKKYLGVICISSDFLDLTGRDKVIGWNKNDFSRPGGRLFGKLNNTAQGQAIVPTQPFGRTYNGTKLLALLCLSDVVAKKWEEVYGDKLVLVTTTALWGEKPVSSYDGLEPFWMRLDPTSGKTPVKFTDDTYEKMRIWMKAHHPKKLEKLQSECNSKARTIHFVMQELEISTEKRSTNAVRLAYMSKLYKNSDAFLRGEITDEQLVPAFHNSVESLTYFWRFGIRGDTTKPLTKQQKKQLRSDFPSIPQDITLNLGASARARIDSLQASAERNHQASPIEIDDATEWYEDLAQLTWDEAKARFLSQVGR